MFFFSNTNFSFKACTEPNSFELCRAVEKSTKLMTRIIRMFSFIPWTSKNSKKIENSECRWQSFMIALFENKGYILFDESWKLALSSSNRFATRHSSNEFDSALAALRFQKFIQENLTNHLHFFRIFRLFRCYSKIILQFFNSWR